MKGLSLILSLTIFTLNMAYAETYKAPKITMPKTEITHHQYAKPKEDHWRSGHQLKDTPEAERSVASDEKWVDTKEREASRDPSSQKEKEKPFNPYRLKPWKFTE